MGAFETSEQPNGLEIAIIGMAGRFPGARNVEELWNNVQGGVRSIATLSDEELLASGVPPDRIYDPAYVKAKGVLENIEFFDAAFFGYTPREAEIMDPQHRLFLECASEALENAGYDPDRYDELIGVYAGTSINSYLLANLYSNPDFIASIGISQLVLGSDKDYLTTRVSYKLNLRGPSLDINTACSTSLVAIHVACRSLLQGECDIALAGGVSVSVPHKTGYLYQEGGVTSPDGYCRAFDARAQGAVPGSGVGIVVLRRLEDALAEGDTILAVIKGSAINNDGAQKVGFTAPGVDGQARAIRAAHLFAEVEPETITYVEAHGTGTPLGDPIEVAALTQAFRMSTDARGFCALGSVKTNIGHLDAAAGVAGLIKTVSALQHALLPPSLHFEQPNPSIAFTSSPFYVNTKLTEWKAGPSLRRAGVSSFGIGGTNAHLVLEEAPVPAISSQSPRPHLLILSAKTETALETMTANLAAHLEKHPELNLSNVAYTYQVGRRIFARRRILVCHDSHEAVHILRNRSAGRLFTSLRETRERPVAFMFPGHGTQYARMTVEIYHAEPVFRAEFERCSALLKPSLGFDLGNFLFADTEHNSEFTQQLNQTAIMLPLLFAVEYALARLWISWGISPQAMIGHSNGEYVAACLAGVFSLEDALALVVRRGQLMEKLPEGAMLSIPLPAEEVSPLFEEGISLAINNAPALCVAAGPRSALDDLANLLAERGVSCRFLPLSHAFHSPMVESAMQPLEDYLAGLSLHPPRIPFISNVTGTWITPAEATDPHYWVRHLRQTVRFTEGIQTLLEKPELLLLEVGPGQTLTSLAKQGLQRTDESRVYSSLCHPQSKDSEYAFLFTTLGRLWLAGVPVAWTQLYAHESRQRLPLPTYPFERRRYWVEPGKSAYQAGRSRIEEEAEPASSAEHASFTSEGYGRPELPNDYEAPSNPFESRIAEIWQELLGIERIGIHDNFFDLGGHSLLATQLVSRLRSTFEVQVPLSALFESPTIAEMATILLQALEQEIDSDLLTEVEQLSSEEIEAVLKNTTKRIQ